MKHAITAIHPAARLEQLHWRMWHADHTTIAEEKEFDRLRDAIGDERHWKAPQPNEDE